MNDVYASEALLEYMWILTVAKRDEVCRDCWVVVMQKGDREYVMFAALSYEPNTKPIRCEKPVCQTCFESRRQLLKDRK